MQLLERVKLARMLQLLVLSFISSQAWSAYVTDNLGELSDSNTQISYTKNIPFFKAGEFSHLYSFSIDESVADNYIDSNVTNHVVSFFCITLKDIDQLAYDVLDGGSNPVFSATSHDPFSMALAAGDYYLSVSGIADGLLGGLYDINLSVGSPVPLPPAALLFISALTGMGIVAKRKKANNA
jgi:hypothetical protein